MSNSFIKLKRIYAKPEKVDGFRILVDRLWPRGLSKEQAQVDLWLRDIAPSNALRIWFAHDPRKWSEFQKRYKRELQDKGEAIQTLQQKIREEKTITFLFGASDEKYNNAAALKKLLRLLKKH